MPERFSGAAGMHAKLLVARNKRLTTALTRLVKALEGLPVHQDAERAYELGTALGKALVLLKERAT